VILFSLRKTVRIARQEQNKSLQKTATLLQTVLFLSFLFVSIYSLRVSWETSILEQTLVNPSKEYLLRWFAMCLLPGLSFLFIHQKQSQGYLYCSWIFLFITSLLTLQLDPQQSLSFTQQGRLASPGLDPISIAHAGVSLVLLSTFIFFKNKAKFLHLASEYIVLLAILIGCYVISLGASRGPSIALFFGMVLLLIGAIRNRVKSQRVSVILFAGLIGLLLASGIAVRAGSSFLYRISGIFAPGSNINPTDSVRMEWLQTSQELIGNNLILGYGLELPGIGYPHNVLVEAFLATGVLGGLIFTIIYLYSIIKAISLVMNQWEQWGWLGLIYIQYAIAVIVSGSLYSSTSFWYLLFAVISRHSIKRAIPSNKGGVMLCE
jgi:hypothetical protein